MAADPLRIGPLTIHRAAEGCDTATFGNPANPGVVLFDGYLFQRRVLRRELKLVDDAGDAAIVAAAYRQWGARVFDRIDGSYLIAIWNPSEGRLLISHDALGHHPVFYAEGRDALWFTSNVLALPRAGAVRPAPNRVSLALAALQYWPAAGETFFEQVRRLRPGHYLSADGGAVREVRYWSPWLEEGDAELSEHQALHEFEPMLIQAIERCMELAPQGIMLSGGLDSVAIAALSAEFSRANHTPMIRAVSGRRDFPRSEEETMQSAVTAALRMDHLVAYESEWIQGRSVVGMSLDAVSELPGPSRIYWVGAYIAFYRFVAAHGLHVLLTGSGGDNWVSVHDAFAAESMRHLRIGALVRHMRSWLGTGGLSFTAAARHLLWSGGLRLILDSHSARWLPYAKRRYHHRRAVAGLPEWLCSDRSLKEAVADTLVLQRPASLTREGRLPRNYYRHAQRSALNPYYEYEFEVGFHVETNCGLRLLSPYHDRHVVRFLNSIPPAVLLQGDKYKGMLRPVAQRRLPGLGLESQRKTYSPGVVEAHVQELRAGVLEAWPACSLEHVAALGIVDIDRVRRRLVATPDVRAEDMMSMYALMSTDRWIGAHISA
jgi:asparagine synthetase B (glutamine-hydrolysing)